MCKELQNSNKLLEVYSEDKVIKFKKDLPSFPTLKRLSLPEVLFFANVYERRVNAAYDNIIYHDDLLSLIKQSKFLPVSLSG